VLLDLLRNLISHFGAGNRLHLLSCMTLETTRIRLDYLTINPRSSVGTAQGCP